MVKNILLYLVILLMVFIFSIFYYAWFSWYLLVLTLCIPFFSLLCSLPFMIFTAVKGVSVFTKDELTVGDELSIGITCRNGKGIFYPLIKVKLRIKNSFTGQKKSMKFLYSGFLKEPVYKKSNKFTNNCGCLEIKAKYIKIYDMLGIFFIPVRLKYNAEVLIMPKAEKPSVMPDRDHIKIIGYKPNISGFAEEYEIRNYQKGDSLKNIHWKISARHNELIVKEPSTPVYRPLVLNPVITASATQNNVTLGKFLYAANFLIKNKNEFSCILPDNKLCKIRSKEDVKRFLLQMYRKTFVSQCLITEENVVIYTITHNAEVVSG